MVKYYENEEFDDIVHIIEDNVVYQMCTFNQGVTIHSDNVLLKANTVTYSNDNSGITILGQNNTVMMNEILSFSIDGIRIVNSFNKVICNYITGSMFGDPNNHNDGIQIFPRWDSVDNKIYGITVSRNRLELSSSEVSTQGIIATDCTVINSVFEDNIIDVDHWHGLTISESMNNRISGNIIYNSLEDSERTPWIKIVSDLGDNRINNNTVPKIATNKAYDNNRVV